VWLSASSQGIGCDLWSYYTGLDWAVGEVDVIWEDEDNFGEMLVETVAD